MGRILHLTLGGTVKNFIIHFKIHLVINCSARIITRRIASDWSGTTGVSKVTEVGRLYCAADQNILLYFLNDPHTLFVKINYLFDLKYVFAKSSKTSYYNYSLVTLKRMVWSMVQCVLVIDETFTAKPR